MNLNPEPTKHQPTAEEILDHQAMAVMVVHRTLSDTEFGPTTYQVVYNNQSAGLILEPVVEYLPGIVINQELIEINNRYHQPVIHDIPEHPDYLIIELPDVTDAKIDPLTRLNNLSHLNDTLNILADGGLSVGFVNLDVDDLKRVNDSQGHDAGNQLLCQFAEILSSLFPKADLHRIGGDEFEVLMSGRDLTSKIVEDRINQLRQVLTDYNQSNPNLPINVSIGYDFIPQSEFSLTENPSEQDRTKDFKRNMIALRQTRTNADSHMYTEKRHRKDSEEEEINQIRLQRLEQIGKDIV